MHEMSLAVALVEELERLRLREAAQRVLTVSVRIGELSGVEAESFAFCFPYAAEGSSADSAKLEVERVAARVRCRDCGVESEPELPILACVSCNSSAVEIVGGKEFTISSMEVE